MPQQYYNAYEIDLDATQVCVHALVQTLPIVQCDIKQGRNGFICAYKVVLCDGSEKTLYSDETWRWRLHTAALECSVFDYKKQEDDWQNAEMMPSVWNLLPSEIRNTEEEPIIPIGERKPFIGVGRKSRGAFRVGMGKDKNSHPQKKGVLTIDMKKGEKAKVSAPDGITYILEE